MIHAKSASGPLDDVEWPQKLTARVVTPGPAPRLHGYDVEGDLARHYSFAETLLLSLTGRLPSTEEARAFDVAMQFAAPAPAQDAPTHAAILARMCVASTSQILGAAAIALGEQARVLVADHAAWLEMLGSRIVEVPLVYRAASDADRESVDRLRRALLGTIHVPALWHSVGRAPAVLAVLYACGLTTAERIECALVTARLPL
ncbi:MAG TPA: hypothetical protein VHS09_07120, partial [Polyangiaceae bacterium]|nr:hypothetical protein [Polyangiaceae bacterium]